MRRINVVLDVYSIVVCSVLFFSLAGSRKKRNGANSAFALICLENIVMMLGDLTNWLCEGTAFRWNGCLLRGGTLIYYLCGPLLLLTFTRYIMEYLRPKVQVCGGVWKTAAGVSLIYGICCIASMFNGMFFYISAGNIYQRGEYFLLSQLIPFSIFMLDTGIIFIYRKYFRRKEVIFFLSYIVLPLLAEIIQIRFEGIGLLNSFITLSLLLIFINILSEKDLLIKQKEAELAEAKVKILLSQIQPHFLYNTLTVIRRLCEVDVAQAKETITNFSRFLRGNMNALTSNKNIPFLKELEHTKYYLAIENKRFGSRLKVVYHIAAKEFDVPPLSLQPIVENAVRHGIIKKAEGGTVMITTRELKREFQIRVADNGAGFGGNRKEAEPGVGISNVKERLSAMCRGTLVINSRPGTGTVAVITIPKEDKHEADHCG